MHQRLLLVEAERLGRAVAGVVGEREQRGGGQRTADPRRRNDKPRAGLERDRVARERPGLEILDQLDRLAADLDTEARTPALGIRGGRSVQRADEVARGIPEGEEGVVAPRSLALGNIVVNRFREGPHSVLWTVVIASGPPARDWTRTP